MAKYVVRVELHNATWDDYERLHRAMGAAGFDKTIFGADGVHYELPPAEYHFDESPLNAQQVHERAKAAANGTGHTNAVMVIDSKGITFSGLKPVQRAAGLGLRKFG